MSDKDYKSLLQEYCQQKGIALPVYRSTKRGDAHRLEWSTIVNVRDIDVTAISKFTQHKKVDSEKDAARLAYKIIHKKGDKNQIKCLSLSDRLSLSGRSIFSDGPTLSEGLSLSDGPSLPERSSSLADSLNPLVSRSFVFSPSIFRPSLKEIQSIVVTDNKAKTLVVPEAKTLVMPKVETLVVPEAKTLVVPDSKDRDRSPISQSESSSGSSSESLTHNPFIGPFVKPRVSLESDLMDRSNQWSQYDPTVSRFNPSIRPDTREPLVLTLGPPLRSSPLNKIVLIDLENVPSNAYRPNPNVLVIGFHNAIHHSIGSYDNWHKCVSFDLDVEIEKAKQAKKLQRLLYLISGGIADLVDHYLSAFAHPLVSYIKSTGFKGEIIILSRDHAAFCTRACIDMMLQSYAIQDVGLRNIGRISEV